MVGEDECETRSALMVGAAVACCLLRSSLSAYCKVKTLAGFYDVRTLNPNLNLNLTHAVFPMSMILNYLPNQSLLSGVKGALDSPDPFDFDQLSVSEASLPRAT